MIDICEGLNEHQKLAVKTDENAVVAAGAGSGKTKVLASRYVYLITEKNYQVEHILALTFTEKAAAEMHRRIYRELQKMYAETDDATQRTRAGVALDAFFKAQIMTIDASESVPISLSTLPNRNGLPIIFRSIFSLSIVQTQTCNTCSAINRLPILSTTSLSNY